MKILFTILIALILTGCIQQRPRNEKGQQIIPESYSGWEIVEYRGYTYVKAYICRGGGITHDPDCIKCKTEKRDSI